MKLSILIPMFNSERFIERCLDSIINQNIPNEEYEIIIIDDSSVDSSKRIVENYIKTYKNIHIYSEQNRGAYFLRNKMLSIAKGKYVYFMDSDDFLINKGFDYLLEIALNKDLDIIGFDALLEYNSSINFDDSDELQSDYIRNIDIPNVQNGQSFVANNKYMRHEVWWYIIKRDFLELNNIFFEEAPFASDVLFTFQTFIKSKRCMHFPKALYKYVQTSNSCTRNKNNEHQLKLVECRIKMIVDFSKFVNSLSNETQQERLIKKNLNFRKYRYVYITIFDILKARVSIKVLKNYIILLKKHNAYPIENIKEVGFNITKYKLISSIFNKEFLLRVTLFILNLKNFK